MALLYGWDISTSAIGICVREDATGKLLRFNVIFPKGETHMAKHRSATAQIRDFLGLSEAFNSSVRGTSTHIVEDCLGGFTGGLTTKQTLMKLASMNAVVSHFLCDWGNVIHIAPITTKRITGLKVPKGGNKKLEVVKLVRSREPTFPYAETPAGNYAKGTDDMADAWLLSEAGLMIISGKATIGQSKKAAGHKKSTGRTEARSSAEGRVRVSLPRKTRNRRMLEPLAGKDQALDKSQ